MNESYKYIEKQCAVFSCHHHIYVKNAFRETKSKEYNADSTMVLQINLLLCEDFRRILGCETLTNICKLA